jgi:PAS domain S-box-containing protein
MFDFLTRLFDTSDFSPRWHCGIWTPGHGWLHILSDLGVWSAYVAIPCVIGYFVVRRRDVPFRTVFLLFGAFILACGTTHLMEAIIFWWPAYRLAGLVKLATAVISWATVVALVPIVPKALAMRSADELKREIEARKNVETELQRNNTDLERRVAERTRELTRAVAAIAAERELLRTTLGSIGDGVIVTDLDGRTTFLNPIAEKLTGWSTAEAKGRPLGDVFRIVSEQTREPLANPVDRALAGKTFSDIESHTILIARDGTETPVDDSAAPIRNTSGGISGAVIVLRDVAKRRRQERELEGRERELRMLAESMPQLAWMADPDGSIFWFNRRWYEYTGTTFDDVKGWGWQKVHDSDRLPAVIDKFRAHLTSGEPWEDTFPLRRHDGEFRWHLSRAMAVKGDDGKVVRWFGTNTDVTESKHTLQQLRESEEQFRTLVNNSPDLISRLDPELRHTFVSPVIERLTGWRPEDLLGKTIEEIGLAEDICRQIRERCHEAVWTRRPVTLELADDRTGKQLVSKIVPETGDGGVVGSFLFMTTDVTERKQAERNLRMQTDRANRLFDSNIIGILFADDERITEANDAFLTMVGYTRAELEAGELRWRAMTPPEHVAAVERGFAELRVRGVCTPYQKEFFRQDGSRIPVLVGKAMVDAPTWVAFVQDMSRIKEVEQKLRDDDRRKDEFLATLAHELRNPLAPLRNGLQVLRMPTGDGDAFEQTRTMMERQLTQLVRLVDDLMDVSRISRGKIELRREQVDLAAVVKSAVETSRPVIEQMGHELAVTLPDDSVIVDVDLVRMAQVLMNLLNNSAKYTERGGRIWLLAERQGPDAVVVVRDTGIGIAAEALPGIFDMFSQVDPSLARSQGGLGIGLTLVKRIVQMHGGTIEAHSAGVGKGSEFLVRIPAVLDATGPVVDMIEPQAHSTALRILVVDDNRDSADSLAMMLRVLGNDTRTAYDGEEAVAAAAEYRPDVILLDLGMPKLNGYDACRRIREQPFGKEIIVIAQTGWGQDEDRQRSQAAGFDHHLVKPLDPVAVTTLLADLEPTRRG